MAGNDRYVADYLYRVTLEQLPERAQQFLRRTAVLDQLSAPLCDALLEISDAYAQLRDLEASNLFLVPLDRRRDWYRYHALFREFLLAELHRAEPEVIGKLHLRAADWYEANGSPMLALEHLLDTPERERAAVLMTALLIPAYETQGMSTVQRWLSTIGATTVAAHPSLAVFAAWISAVIGDPREAQRWADVVDAASSDPAASDDASTLESSRAMLRGVMCADGVEAMMARAQLAVDSEPEWSLWRDTALGLYGEAHLLVGDLDKARAAFAEASSLATTVGNNATIAISESELALLAMDGGQWSEAAEHLASGLTAIEEHRLHDDAMATLIFAGAARLALHRGDLDDTHRQLARGMRARPVCTFALPWLAVRLRLQLAKVYVALADATSARHLLREIDDVLLHRPALGTLVDEVSELRADPVGGNVRRGRGRSPAQPGGAAGAPLPPDAPHPPRGRQSTVRLLEHRAIPGRIDLPQARRLIAQRRRATGHRHRPARRLARPIRPRSSNASSVGTTHPPSPESSSWDDAVGRDSSSTVRMTTAMQHTTLTAEQLVEMLRLSGSSDSVELKLTVPAADRRATAAALEVDPLGAQIRQVVFFDTPDLTLNQNGVVVRARRVQAKGDDSVVKLRPVVPTELPGKLRKSPDFKVEVDAMPGGFVCSGSYKGTLGQDDVKEVLMGRRPVRKLFSKQQRAFFADHAPAGIELDDLAVLGPLSTTKLKFQPTGLKRKLVAEMWLYPDGSQIIELSTKCTPAETIDVATETRAFLADRGVNLEGEQQTKTKTALEFFVRELREKPA